MSSTEEQGPNISKESISCISKIESTDGKGSSTVTSKSTNDVTADQEVSWLRSCLPIIVQPKIDVMNGNHLVKVFYAFERDSAHNQLNCKLGS